MRAARPRRPDLKQGDLIVKVGDRAIGTIYDYMDIMSKHKPGEKLDVVVKRDGKDVKVPVTLGSRSRMTAELVRGCLDGTDAFEPYSLRDPVARFIGCCVRGSLDTPPHSAGAPSRRPRIAAATGWAASLALGLLAVVLTGCERPASSVLVVATSWPVKERVRMQSEFQKWQASSMPGAGQQPISVQWLLLMAGDPLEPVARLRRPPDVLLGGRASVV